MQVEPIGVHRLDERELRAPTASLDLLLAGDGVDDAFVPLVPDEHPAPVLLCESRARSLAMLLNPPLQARGHARIERAVAPAGHDVNVGFSHRGTGNSQAAGYAARAFMI